MHLFVIYIGGSIEKALIELHDMRFVAARTIEETYDTLRKTWWGKPESLHLDAWGILNYAEGYEIKLIPKDNLTSENEHPEKLYFLNLGGYDSNQFTELHRNVFVVAKDKQSAKIKAKTQVAHWEVPHTDAQFELENIISVQDSLNDSNSSWQIVLTKHNEEKSFDFICKYVPIGEVVIS